MSDGERGTECRRQAAPYYYNLFGGPNGTYENGVEGVTYIRDFFNRTMRRSPVSRAKRESRDIELGSSFRDYSKYRPGYPDSYFLLLQELGIGLKNQDILDIGMGTGALALPFAKQEAQVTGVDISRGQIEAAKTLASQKKLNVRFIVAKAEETGTS